MRLTVIGCGYVGLVTGACLAAAGHEVFCTDIDEKRIAQLKAGKVPIYEEHLEEVLQRAAAEKKISYTADAGEAIRAGEVIFICVGTPPKETSEADLSAIDHVARQIAVEAQTAKLVVEKSTVPALTACSSRKLLWLIHAAARKSFRSRRIQNSSARERRLTIFFIPTVLSSAWRTRRAPRNCGKCTHPSWNGSSIAPFIRGNAPAALAVSCW